LCLVWFDTRTKDLVEKYIQKTSEGSAFAFLEKCGLPLSTYFSAFKLRWFLDNVPAASKAYQEQRLRFGTVDSWLLYVHMRTLIPGNNVFVFNHRNY
jgi:glycerol kinase